MAMFGMGGRTPFEKMGIKVLSSRVDPRLEDLMGHGSFDRPGLPYGTPPYAPTNEERAANDAASLSGGAPVREPSFDGTANAGTPPSVAAGAGAGDPRLLAMIGERPAGDHKGFFNDETAQKIFRAMALMSGNYGAAAAITQRISGDKKAETQRLATWEAARRIASLPGMTERELASYLANPEQWGSNMSDALSTHQAAANVGQTETRVFGNPNNGGHVYQPPRLIENGTDQIRYDPTTGASSVAVQGMTDGEQYARSLGIQPGTTAWDNAVRDQMLKGDGPTAYGNDTRLEAQRQSGRERLRGMPTYSQTHPTAKTKPAKRGKSRPTATGPNGQKVEWNGARWVPVN